MSSRQQRPKEEAGGSSTQAAKRGQPENHALQEYERQLRLLEEENKIRLLMAKREYDTITASDGQSASSMKFIKVTTAAHSSIQAPRQRTASIASSVDKDAETQESIRPSTLTAETQDDTFFLEEFIMTMGADDFGEDVEKGLPDFDFDAFLGEDHERGHRPTFVTDDGRRIEMGPKEGSGDFFTEDQMVFRDEGYLSGSVRMSTPDSWRWTLAARAAGAAGGAETARFAKMDYPSDSWMGRNHEDEYDGLLGCEAPLPLAREVKDVAEELSHTAGFLVSQFGIAQSREDDFSRPWSSKIQERERADRCVPRGLVELCRTTDHDEQEETTVEATQYLVSAAYQANMQHVLSVKSSSNKMVDPKIGMETALPEMVSRGV